MKNDRERIVIFSGTTEGRSLSEMLSKSGIAHTVCVATEYGELMQPKSELVLLKEGRMNKEDMVSFFDGKNIVIDATHPFATEVTDNIRTACKLAKVKYVRVLREEECCYDDIMTSKYHDDIPSCIKALNQVEGNILFTTGSKDLPEISGLIDDISRVYVRVLPSVTSIQICEEAGIRNDHIIAMHGPFDEDMNLAIIRQYGIKALVTKDSGKAGGVDEKLSACKAADIPCFVIKRPKHETGVSVEEAFELIKDTCETKDQGKQPSHEDGSINQNEVESIREINFSIIGIGMGQKNGLTLEALSAIEAADVVFGAERLIEVAGSKQKYPFYLAKDITNKVEEIIDKGESIQNVAVLFSGDIGFYSGAAKFEEGVRSWSEALGKVEIKISRYPGISSVAALSAKIGESYSDAEIISLHGRNSDEEFDIAANRILHSKKSFILLSTGEDIQKIAKILKNRRADARIIVGDRISYPDEKIQEYRLKNIPAAAARGPVIIFIENLEVQPQSLIPYIEDEEFTRDKTPMTKALIRHEAIRLLNLKAGDIFFDVGSGTGSIAIEAAKLSSTLQVYSYEKKPDAIALQKQNIGKFECQNIRLIEGIAPDSFVNDIYPDAVFIGGSTGRLGDILTYLKESPKTIRVVVTAITLETMNEIYALSKDERIKNLDIRQISESKAQKAGDYHLMKSENAVMVAAFDLDSNN